MDFKVVITDSAIEDLQEIVERVARDNSTAAERLGNAILERFFSLAPFPFLGRVVPERQEVEWRELIYKPYRLIYYVDERRKVIHAARVWHAARGKPETQEIRD